MFKTRAEAGQMISQLLERLGSHSGVEVLVCPPFTALGVVQALLEGSQVRLGAQNVHWEPEGACTGEISIPMLEECGCHYVILGHSERRQFFEETDDALSRKLEKSLASSMIPILCVGESLQEREAGRVDEVVLGQLEGAAGQLTASQAARMIVAYEPVWAIGTGKTATPEIAQEVHHMIRGWLAKQFSNQVSGQVRLLYGGSVKPDNTRSLMSQADIDGALVGGASLEAESFARIVEESGTSS